MTTRAPARQFSTNERAEIAAEYRRGDPLRVIAERHGTNPPTVCAIAKRQGVPSRADLYAQKRALSCPAEAPPPVPAPAPARHDPDGIIEALLAEPSLPRIRRTYEPPRVRIAGCPPGWPSAQRKA